MFSRTFSAIVGESPSAYRQRGVVHPVPSCFAMAWTRPSSHTHPEAMSGYAHPAPFRTVGTMITSLAISQIFVLDQDEALDFVGKLGLEVATDVDFFMRWLTVCVRRPGEILLEAPKPPVYDPETTDAVREMVTKQLPAAPCSSTPMTRSRPTPGAQEQGVELAEEPTEQSCGTTSARDPFGNNIRIGGRP